VEAAATGCSMERLDMDGLDGWTMNEI